VIYLRFYLGFHKDLSGKIFVTLLTISRYMFVAQISLISPAELIDNDLVSVICRFSNNGMVANPDKFQEIFLGTADNNISIDIIGSAKIVGSK